MSQQPSAYWRRGVGSALYAPAWALDWYGLRGRGVKGLRGECAWVRAFGGMWRGLAGRIRDRGSRIEACGGPRGAAGRRRRCCGLLAGWGRLHCGDCRCRGGEVADCSQAGVDYTVAVADPRAVSVADCSQAGVDYTAQTARLLSCSVADCSQAGVDYTNTVDEAEHSLVADCSQAGVDYTAWHRLRPSARVADCSQAGVDYTTNP